MGAENAEKGFFAVEGYPGELAAVVVQEARGKAYTFACGNVYSCGVMVRAVEIADLTGIDQTVLYCLKGGR